MSVSLRLLTLVLALLISAGELRAQWSNVAPGLVPTPTNSAGKPEGGGVIVHKDGLIWAGSRGVFVSKDQGINWEQRASPLVSVDFIRYLDFYNDSIGLLSASNGDTWLTTDQGNSWRRLRSTQSNWAARFVNSPRNIVIAGASSGILETTTDGGATWKSQKIGTFVPFVVPLLGGSIYALIATGKESKTSAYIWRSSDYGLTWTQGIDSIGFDSYSFGVDMCSPERIYVANEDAGGSNWNINGFSEIYVSSNSGDGWAVTHSTAGKELTGSVSVASNAIYMQRLQGGILRSTDFGNTWIDIGGPAADYDSRMVCAVTDNLIIAADRAGNIWRTTNAGGDSVHGEIRLSEITSTPEGLFFGDTLFSCEDPTFDSLFINSIFCVAPRVVSVVIEGEHPLDFTLTSDVPSILTGADTLTFRFMPRGNGERRANLRIVLEDSSTIIVPMRGFGKGLTELNTTTASASTDTLGATVYLPIRYESAGEMTGVAMQLSYTSDQIEFVDAYDLLGVSVAVPTQNAKRIQLNFPGVVAQNGLIGHAAFRVYSGDTACLPVLFDSIVAISSRPPCAFAINPTMTAEICVPIDCLAQHVSDYLRYGNLPKLTLNHIGRDLLLTADKNFGEVTVRVISTLGAIEATHTAELRSDRPMRFSINDIHEGLYFIELRSKLGSRVMKLAVQR